MFWIVSERFVDAETDPKAYFALFGAVIFCTFWVLQTFRWDMSSKFCFTDFAAAIMLCAVSQAFYAILQKTKLGDLAAAVAQNFHIIALALQRSLQQPELGNGHICLLYTSRCV